MAILEITLKASGANRAAAAEVYRKYKQPFLDQAPGAKSKELFVREEDVQVLHRFSSREEATAYLSSELFATDIVSELGPLLEDEPDVRIYDEV